MKSRVAPLGSTRMPPKTPGRGDHRADREVDARGRDDEGHADREHPDDAGLGQHVADVVPGREGLRLEDRAGDEEGDDDERQRVLLELERAEAGAQRSPRRSCDLLDQIGVAVGATAWRAARARSRSAPSTSATSSPSRMTRTRLQMPGQLLELRGDDEHADAGRGELADDPVDLGLGATSTPRVGSSSSSTRQSRSSQRASTTFCWLPPESSPGEPIGVVGDVLQRAQLLARRRRARCLTLSRPLAEAAEVGEGHVLGQVPVEQQALRLAVLRGEAEAGGDRPVGPVRRQAPALDPDLAGSRRSSAADQPQQLGAAGADQAADAERSRRPAPRG